MERDAKTMRQRANHAMHANSAMTMILGLHDMQHNKTTTKLGLKKDSLKWIKPKHTALVQVRSGANSGLTNTFKEVILAS